MVRGLIVLSRMACRTLSRLVQKLRPGFYTSCKCTSDSGQKSTQTDNQDTKVGTENDVVLPPEPDYCCMSGCANCVWIKYAQELAQSFGNGDELARQKILEKVHDPNQRAFLLTQLGLKEDESRN